MIGYAVEKVEAHEHSGRRMIMDTRDESEDRQGQEELGLGPGSPFDVLVNAVTELSERLIVGFYAEVSAENRRQRHPDRACVLRLARDHPPIQQTIKEELCKNVG